MKSTLSKPELIYRDGEPVAVILAMEDYQELLERLEDAEDLKTLETMRKQPVKFKSLDEFPASYSPDV
jgi:PHD/YefM family antitoxin component YafN of YafNO toxin-antitoxin module